jgi:hypothetical protein
MHNRNVRKWAWVFAGIVVALIIAAIVVVRHFEPSVKNRLEKILAERFDSDVQIGKLAIRLFPRASVTVQDVKLRFHHRTDVPPLISIKEISATSDFASLLLGAQHDVNLVKLVGLRITIPHGTLQRSQFQPQKQSSGQGNDDGNHLPFLVHKIVADGTTLVILSKKPGREPMVWDIEKLTMTSVGAKQPMNFVATLTNAKPPGLINTKGTFGPWKKQDPSETPVGGHYTFKNADLGVFNGISGILASVGDYTGTLDQIDVEGTTDTPDFRVGDGNPVDLKTKFSATVDGTNGDTSLHPVDATFGNSRFLCNGDVVGTPGIKGKAVRLQVAAPNARIEDILLLVLDSKKPPLTGGIDFESKFLLPQGEVPVVQKLILDGRFGLRSFHFTSNKLQHRLNNLSGRSRGIDDKSEQPTVASNMKGRFLLKNSVAKLSGLSFSVPGIQVNLNGTYGLKTEQINFHGHVNLQGTLSDMTTGWKSLLLKAADPFFRHNGRTVLPIKITGTKSDPNFGVDFHHDKNKR